jgi:EAL and modified HD-GYP domain-containing signal transduction protein
MASWFSRWFGSGDPASAPPPEAGSAAATASASPPIETSATCRRPLFDRKGQLAGFEFRLAGSLAQRMQRRGDAVAHAAYATALLNAMSASMKGERVALLSLPLAIAVRSAVRDAVPARAMLALTGEAGGDPQLPAALADLRRHGALLGRAGSVLPGGQFVLVECQKIASDALPGILESFRRSDPALRLVATGLATIDAVEAALEVGADLAAGDTDRSAAPPASRSLAPRMQRLCQLLNRLARDEDLDLLAGELRTDVDLVYRLLRYANSPLLGLTRPAESVEQAVMLLGRDGLYRWLTFLMLAGADGRATSRALHEVALARARLLEMLAPRLGAPAPALFTTGLFSLMEVMLRMPMDEAIGPLQLPAPAMQALVQRGGPWRPALDLAIALERDEPAAVESLAAGLGGLEEVTRLAQEAWSWASEAVAQTKAA